MRIGDDGASRQSFDSAERFLSDRFSFAAVVPANSADVALTDKGLYPWGDGVLFDDSGTIYEVSGGQKHPFTSAAAFLGQGFQFRMAVNGNLSSLPLGSAISNPSAAHLPGTFISAAGEILQATSAAASAYPSAAVFASNGGAFSDVVPANAADEASFSSAPAVVPYRTGSIINDSGALWAITSTGKLGFPSAACYTNFGFSFASAIAGSTSGITSSGTICGDNPNSDGLTSYYTQTVSADGGQFGVSVITADLSTKKIRVFTEDAAHADCITNCPVQPLASYLSEDGAMAGTNGSYFCPTAYGASCAGKTNSFYAKMIDSQTGMLINASDEYGRTFPLITFAADGTPTWWPQESQYESSGVHAAAGIGYFGLVQNGQVSLQSNLLDSQQMIEATTQGAIGLKGQTLYLVHVAGATVPQEAAVLQAMGLDDALLLDGGGSTAMMYQGSYKNGPGRDIPNAVTFAEVQ